jgi:hypothetical protein
MSAFTIKLALVGSGGKKVDSSMHLKKSKGTAFSSDDPHDAYRVVSSRYHYSDCDYDSMHH